jgi:hypothetical protein
MYVDLQELVLFLCFSPFFLFHFPSIPLHYLLFSFSPLLFWRLFSEVHREEIWDVTLIQTTAAYFWLFHYMHKFSWTIVNKYFSLSPFSLHFSFSSSSIYSSCSASYSSSVFILLLLLLILLRVQIHPLLLSATDQFDPCYPQSLVTLKVLFCNAIELP